MSMTATTLRRLAAAALIFSLAACGSHENADKHAADTDKAERTVVIGLDDNFPPMGFRDDQNNLVGFDIDMAKEALKRLHMKAEFKPIDWSAKESELSSKRIDALWNGLTITPEREKVILFTKPYMKNHQIIIVRKDSPIQTKNDLKGHIVGIQEGSSAESIEKEPLRAELADLKKYPDFVNAFLNLDQKRVDALVADEVVSRYLIAKKPENYRVLQDDFGVEDYGVGMRQGDTELKTALDNTLDEMKADGTAATISEKWFGKNIVN